MKLYFIALTLGMAAVTFLIRFSFIGLAGKIQMSRSGWKAESALRCRAGPTVLPPADHHHHSGILSVTCAYGVRLKIRR
ncbi:hypothetical protein LNQ52_07480 [Klebsiella pneumoniae subsp. pneumoniae]|nr:hypothetical protein [Klebsiella pneumoniae subsp. pneumoniae]